MNRNLTTYKSSNSNACKGVLAYRFSFNGKEKDPEGMGGGGATYDYGFRIYNPQIAKFLSVDPLTYSFAWNSTYCYAENSPIYGIDLDGGEFLTSIQDLACKFAVVMTVELAKEVVYKVDAAAATALITTAKTIYPGVDKANEDMKQKQFKSHPDVAVAILLYEFATGTGIDNRTFTDANEKGTFAYAVIQGPVLNEVRDKFEERMKHMTLKEFKKTGVKNISYDFSPDKTSTIQESYEKHINANLAQFFVGGADVMITATEDPNWVNVTVTNPTSRSSLLLHVADNYPRDEKNTGKEKPLSTTTQTFTFKMKVDPSKFKTEEKKFQEKKTEGKKK